MTRLFFTLCAVCVFAVLVSAQERDSFTDSRDGKTYRVVTIGSQTWMAENLNYQTDNSWCYDDDEFNCNIYGRLYDWNTALTACPDGWHLPTDADWNALTDALGGSTKAGGKLKSRVGWGKNGNGTDDYGFNALPGGSRWRRSFRNVGYYGYWWSATENAKSRVRYRLIMGDSSEYVATNWGNKRSGFSVRCIKD